MTKPKIYVWDLEFFASKDWKGRLKAHPGYIICFCCKELGDPKITTYSSLTHPGKNILDDRALVEAIGNKLRDGYMHILQNGAEIDFKFMQTRLLKYGLEPLPWPATIVDTCLVARQKLSLKSNSMRELVRFFGLEEEKQDISEEEWYLAFNGNRQIMRKVEKRCASDVRITEQIYLKELPLIPHPKNVPNSFTSNLPKFCEWCGSNRILNNGIRSTQSSAKNRYVCGKCRRGGSVPIKVAKGA